MGKEKIVIVDTGCANVSSVRFAIQRLGYLPLLSADARVILDADKIFLPGVGTASQGMKNLKERELLPTLSQISQPLLGICLGMQLLGLSSEEGAFHDQKNEPVKGLGRIKTHTQRMKTQGKPLPHMGWNTVSAKEGHPLFKGIPQESYFYFVHQYAMPLNPFTVATCSYETPFSAAVENKNYFGVQFHPERSSQAGARLIRNFLEM